MSQLINYDNREVAPWSQAQAGPYSLAINGDAATGFGWGLAAGAFLTLLILAQSK